MLNLHTGEKCFLLTGKGLLMPATFAGWHTNERGFVFPQVAAPGGKVYTCLEENVFDTETGRIMLYHRRAEQLAAEGYKIAVRNDGSFRVYNPRKHGAEGGYIVNADGCGTAESVCATRLQATCNCPAFAPETLCKHSMAVCSLLIRKAEQARARNWKPGATRYTNLATALAA